MTTEEKRDMVAIGRRWSTELELAKKSDQTWIGRGKKIVKRYRDERPGSRNSAKKYNILWSNVETILPAVYARTPKAEVVRRNKDADPVARTAAEILERSLQYELDVYSDFADTMGLAVKDRLLPGRGTAWIRFESEESTEVIDGKETAKTEKECAAVDYVYWEDFRCSPARTWGEVTWVSRRVYMSRKEGVKRFGGVFKTVPLTHVPIGLDELKDRGATDGDTEAMKRAEVWEIWDKTEKEVTWIANGFTQALDVKADPYDLDDFWPCPKPLYATQTSDTLVPVPDYSLYQDQAQELDLLTQRIGMLVEALKVVGVYDASQDGVQRMLSEGVSNELIPVNNWAAFSEKGGIKGVVDFLPLDMVAATLGQCYEAREQCKQVIYEITGISDIIRGATEASETATAQNIKRQFGSLRLQPRQQDVAIFATEILRIKAQMMMDLYSAETLKQMSGIESTDDAQYADQAIALLKSEPARQYRIEVAADSMIEMDQEQEKQSRTEFLSAAGQFMNQVLPVVQEVPQLKQLVCEMMMFGVRAYPAGRSIEGAFEKAMSELSQPQQPKQDPAMAKVQADQQLAQQQLQSDQAKAQMKLQSDAQTAQIKAQSDAAIEQARMQADIHVQEIKIQSQNALETARAQMQMQMDQAKHQAELDHKAMLAQAEMTFARWKAELEAATKIEVANITSKAKMQDAATDTATKEIASEVTQ